MPKPRYYNTADVLAVAKYQRAILICILAYLTLIIASFVVPPEMKLAILGLIVLLALTSAVFTILLSARVYSTGLGIVFGMLCLFPLVALLILPIINSRATTVLKYHDIRVGFLGANGDDLKSFERAGQFREEDDDEYDDGNDDDDENDYEPKRAKRA